jgi:cytidylate kinase
MAIITISRGTMSGGEALANCVAESLNYPCLAREVLVEAAGKLGAPEQVLRWSIIERGTLWERMTTDRRLYLIALQAALAQRCVLGNLVYHGNAGHLLLKALPNVLKVRLIAPLEARIRKLRQDEGLSYEAARDFIDCADRGRIEWTRFVYDLDWSSAELYDLVINLHDISIETACGIITGTATLPAYAVTEEVRKKLRDFALACRVKLALASNVHTRHTEFEVSADDGKVEIAVGAPTPGILARQSGPHEEEITPIVRKVHGVERVLVGNNRSPAYSDA